MKHIKKINRKGFTLVELLVVIIIIAIIGTLGVGSYSAVMSQSRDIKRKRDLKDVATALEAYYSKTGSYNVPGGHNNLGIGYVNFTNTTNYATSISMALNTLGYLKSPILKDPTEAAPQEGYMLYTCLVSGKDYYAITATLENPDKTDSDVDGIPDELERAQKSCSGGFTTNTTYKKNYVETNQSIQLVP